MEALTMAPTRTPRSSWIDAGMRALGAGGPDAVRIEPLAKALGVTKGGFYWHFDGRPALLDEMLDTWERISIDEVIERVEGGGGDARAKLRRLFSISSSRDARTILDADLAVRDWSRRDRKVARRLRRVDNRRMDYLRSLFAEVSADADDAEVRSTLAFSLFVGGEFMAVDHGPRSRREVVELALARLLA
jgi:AcrR family transcriptional regulator